MTPYSTQTCCKINLGLNITERRPDGYHNLQTIFYPVPLCDELTIREGQDEDVLTLGGNVASADEGTFLTQYYFPGFYDGGPGSVRAQKYYLDGQQVLLQNPY